MIELIRNSGPLAIWGALLSTVLAGIKIWEIWDTRTKIEVGRNFTSSESIGNEIIIRNISPRPLIVVYWMIIWKKKVGLRWVITKRIDADENMEDIRIEPYGSKKILFREEHYFSTNSDIIGNERIYAALLFAGKYKVYEELLYEPDKN